MRRFDSGGIKVIRVLIIFRTILQDVFRMIHPRAVTPFTSADAWCRERADRGPRALRGLDGNIRYSDLYRGATGELTHPLSATAVATTLNDVGPGLGQVGATESFEIVNP